MLIYLHKNLFFEDWVSKLIQDSVFLLYNGAKKVLRMNLGSNCQKCSFVYLVDHIIGFSWEKHASYLAVVKLTFNERVENESFLVHI